MAKLINLTGQKFGKLTVLNRFSENGKQGQLKWVCICECGNISVVFGGNLKQGYTKSCGECPNDFWVNENSEIEIQINSKTHGNPIVLVDVQDFDVIKNRRWVVNGIGYILNTEEGYLARLIMKPGKHEIVDHISGNKFDNRRSNLRICGQSENQCNRGPNKNNTTGYKNVQFHKSSGKFFVKVVKDGRAYHGGYFNTKEEAVAKAEQMRQSLHGEFARASF